ncbi:hypothetical protein [Streptomyces cucumeris]|uniref:hypothetical protein n=1 Tax=Streptomyces cucumeris TaxID=2962890 RepID=UPI003D75FF22
MPGNIIAGASALFAFFAVGVSFKALRVSQRQQRRDLFLALHEKLSREDQQSGRTVLRERIHSVEDAKDIRAHDAEGHRQAASALAMLDILGLYAEKGFVDKRLVLEEWGRVLVELDYNIRYALRERKQQTQTEWLPWPHLQRLLRDAEEWAEKQNPGLPRG